MDTAGRPFVSGILHAMSFPIDLTQWRVYSAEQSLPSGRVFENGEEAATFLWWVQSTRWWKTTFPDAPTIRVEIGGGADAGEIQSYAQKLSDSESLISLHPRMLNAAVLLHEVAHCIAPRYHGDLRKIAQDKVVTQRHHHHGEFFRAAFCALADRFKLGVEPDELRAAYTHFELDAPDLNALIEARAHSAAVEAATAEMWARSELRAATDPATIALRARARAAGEAHRAEHETERSEGWIPPSWWGDWIWLTRRHFRPKVSQQRLAEEVASVVKCSARDVARLERSKTAPTALVDWKRSLAFVAVMGLDPVWAETHKGLAPGERTLTLEELEEVGPEWVADVRHLNALLASRPPRWEASGDR